MQGDMHTQVKLATLQKIMDLMDDLKGQGLKKPDATMLSIKAEGSPLEEAGESADQEKAEDSGSGMAAMMTKAAGGGAEEPDEDDELLKKLIAERMSIK